MENKGQIITTGEQEFLTYYEKVAAHNLHWTYRSAALALGYKSTGSIMRIVESLRAKGYTIETKRSSRLIWKRTVNTR